MLCATASSYSASFSGVTFSSCLAFSNAVRLSLYSCSNLSSSGFRPASLPASPFSAISIAALRFTNAAIILSIAVSLSNALKESASDSLVETLTLSDAEITADSLSDALADSASNSLTEALALSDVEIAADSLSDALTDSASNSLTEALASSDADAAADSLSEILAASASDSLTETLSLSDAEATSSLLSPEPFSDPLSSSSVAESCSEPLPCSSLAESFSDSLPCSSAAESFSDSLPCSSLAESFSDSLPCSSLAESFSDPASSFSSWLDSTVPALSAADSSPLDACSLLSALSLGNVDSVSVADSFTGSLDSESVNDILSLSAANTTFASNVAAPKKMPAVPAAFKTLLALLVLRVVLLILILSYLFASLHILLFVYHSGCPAPQFSGKSPLRSFHSAKISLDNWINSIPLCIPTAVTPPSLCPAKSQYPESQLRFGIPVGLAERIIRPAYGDLHVFHIRPVIINM